MERKIRLYIVLDNEHYSSREVITGAVHLKTYDPINLESVKLILTKFYEASLKTDNTSDAYLEKKIIYKHTFELYISQDEFTKISSGHHTYPFKFHLKQNDNASTDLIQLFNKSLYKIKNQYVLESNIKLYGIYMPLVHTKIMIPVVDYTPKAIEEVANIELSSCFCFIKRYFNMISVLDKDFYYSGDTAKILIKLDNANRIDHVDVYMCQILTLYIQDKFTTKSRLVAHSNNKFLETKNGDIECDIRIPNESPSTASEQNFDIKYIVQMIVSLDRASPIRIKKDIYIIKRMKTANIDNDLNLLKGIDATCKYFSLD